MTADGAGDAAALVSSLFDEVWNQRNVGSLRELLAENAIVCPPGGSERWRRDDLAAHVLATLAAFPDLHGSLASTIAHEEAGATRVAARWSWGGTNRGYSFAGPPTGHAVSDDTLVFASVRLGRIVELWLIGDEARLLRQLGHDPLAIARERRAALRDRWPARDIGGLPFERAAHAARAADATPASIAQQLIGDVWNGQLLGRLPALYAPDADRHAPDGDSSGPDEIGAALLALLAAFPDAAVQLDDLLASDAQIALRWTLRATHRGPGVWGPPSGRLVQLSGGTLLRISAGRIQEEHAFWNALALLEQLLPDVPDADDANPLLSS